MRDGGLIVSIVFIVLAVGIRMLFKQDGLEKGTYNKYCPNCNKRLERAFMNKYSNNLSWSKYCPDCGHHLHSNKKDEGEE